MSTITAVHITTRATLPQPNRQTVGLTGFSSISLTRAEFDSNPKWITAPVSQQVGLPLQFTTKIPSRFNFEVKTGANLTARILLQHVDPDAVNYRKVVDGAVSRGDFIVARVDGKPLEELQLYNIALFVHDAIQRHEANRVLQAKNRQFLSPLAEQFKKRMLKAVFDELHELAVQQGDTLMVQMNNPFVEEEIQTENHGDFEGTPAAHPSFDPTVGADRPTRSRGSGTVEHGTCEA